MISLNSAVVMAAIVFLVGCDITNRCENGVEGGAGGENVGTNSLGQGLNGGSGGADGTGGAASTTSTCDPSTCPAPAEPDCAAAFCDAGECAIFNYTKEAMCGFAAACDGSGHCVGQKEPLECADPCTDEGECAHSNCNPYTGTCEVMYSGNGTSCGEGGAGHCNSKEGTCCEGVQYASCPGIPDPAACFKACIDDPSVCTHTCAAICPFGTAELPGQGFCFPIL